MYKYLIIDVEDKETHVESKEKPTTEEMQKIVCGNPTLVHCRYEGRAVSYTHLTLPTILRV